MERTEQALWFFVASVGALVAAGMLADGGFWWTALASLAVALMAGMVALERHPGL